MSEIKFIEIRDEGTFIPAMATRIHGADNWLVRASGYGRTSYYVILTQLNGPVSQYNASKWGKGTMWTVHDYIKEHWDEIKDGDLIDARFIRGEIERLPDSEQENYKCAESYFS